MSEPRVTLSIDVPLGQARQLAAVGPHHLLAVIGAAAQRAIADYEAAHKPRFLRMRGEFEWNVHDAERRVTVAHFDSVAFPDAEARAVALAAELNGETG